jgi:hypothetical protein
MPSLFGRASRRGFFRGRQLAVSGDGVWVVCKARHDQAASIHCSNLTLGCSSESGREGTVIGDSGRIRTGGAIPIIKEATWSTLIISKSGNVLGTVGTARKST